MPWSDGQIKQCRDEERIAVRRVSALMPPKIPCRRLFRYRVENDERSIHATWAGRDAQRNARLWWRLQSIRNSWLIWPPKDVQAYHHGVHLMAAFISCADGDSRCHYHLHRSVFFPCVHRCAISYTAVTGCSRICLRHFTDHAWRRWYSQLCKAAPLPRRAHHKHKRNRARLR